MNNIFRARVATRTLAAAAAVAATLLLAPAAHAGPDALGDAEEVINSLKNQGHKVIVTKTGSKPLSECVVTGVRKDLDVYGATQGTNCPNCNGSARRNQTVRLYSIYHVEIQC
ncbi:hypothetical protein [Mycobacteroides franklinii]|uniref:hypothetical protein n=1 Tax=Mycobacteroides franklinii TaxID=948102 RepID=UPI0013E8F37B|nr:hypothetical protein [Mycobacteroides franklinii]